MRSKKLLAAGLLGVMAAVCASAQFPRPAIAQGVGIDQKLNSQIPLDLMFHDERGDAVPLRSYFGDKPVVISMVYFSCGSLCPMSIKETVTSLDRLPLKPGADYNVLVVSFDPKDTPAIASKEKAEFSKYYKEAGYTDGFHFLTGDQAAISKLADAVGWRYKWDQATQQFVHAGGIMVATPEGKMSRYFYGLAYAPQDVRLALVEASQHKIGSPVDYITLFCFHYDPTTGKYTLAITNLLKVTGCLTVVLLAGFIFMFMKNDKNRSSKEDWKEAPHAR
jgi:protein SCO1/2